MKKPLYVAKKRLYCSFKLWLIIPAIILIAVTIWHYFRFGGLSHMKVCMNHLIPFVAFVLITLVPIVWQLHLSIRIKSYKLTIYKDRIVEKIGLVCARREAQYLFIGVKDVYVGRGFWGTMLDFGEVIVELAGDCPVKFEVRVHNIAEPDSLKHFLESQFIPVKKTSIVVGL